MKLNERKYNLIHRRVLDPIKTVTITQHGESFRNYVFDGYTAYLLNVTDSLDDAIEWTNDYQVEHQRRQSY
jgi:hypothetical protein